MAAVLLLSDSYPSQLDHGRLAPSFLLLAGTKMLQAESAVRETIPGQCGVALLAADGTGVQ